MKVSRGDVVLLPIAFVSGQGTKVRPAVVLQNDNLNARLNSTVVAIITSTNTRAQTEPSQLFIEVSTTDGRQTGLLHDSTVKGEHIDTVDQRDVLRKIGTFSPALLQQLEGCVKAALLFT
jgi:mRNA interferase MazF